LRTLQEENKDTLSVLAFPCNQFGAQEPGSNEEILEFATSRFDVNFPMFAKIEVNGDGACELYKQLTSAKADEEGNSAIAWNFTKFLVNGDGDVVARFAPQVTPEEIGGQLSTLLG
jgi:glutathione peroxidase